MTSQSGKQTIKIHILHIISGWEGNHTMKFGQLIEILFLRKPYTKCGGKTSPSLFYKKSKLNISLDQQSLFLLYAQIEDY